jgi:hypothetical protein
MRQTPDLANAAKAVERRSLFLTGAVLAALVAGCATSRHTTRYQSDGSNSAADYFAQTQDRWNQTHNDSH